MLYFLSPSQAVANNSQIGTDNFFSFNFSTISKSTVKENIVLYKAYYALLFKDIIGQNNQEDYIPAILKVINYLNGQKYPIMSKVHNK